MKLTIIALLTFGSLTSFAQSLPKGVVYSRPGTQGEYPAAFKVKSDVTIFLSKTNSPAAPLTEKCLLKKNKKIIFAKESSVVTHTYTTGKYNVLADMTIVVSTGDADQELKVPAGSVIENVSYYTEGFCAIRLNGKTYEASCVGMGGDEAGLKEVTALDTESWVKLSCANGKKGWASEKMLEANKQLEPFMYNPYEN